MLFGSYAYGTPHAESDVDLLVIMPTRDRVQQAIRIELAFEPPFSLDLIVRTPKQIERGLREDDWFLREIMEKGKVVYEAPNRPVGGKAEEDWAGAGTLTAQSPPLTDLVCFHCQQAAEKYLKALLQEQGAVVPKTHDLRHLLRLLLPHDPTLRSLQRGLLSLGRYAVEYRYPGLRATRRGMQTALRHTERIRRDVRADSGLPIEAVADWQAEPTIDEKVSDLVTCLAFSAGAPCGFVPGT